MTHCTKPQPSIWNCVICGICFIREEDADNVRYQFGSLMFLLKSRLSLVTCIFSSSFLGQSFAASWLERLLSTGPIQSSFVRKKKKKLMFVISLMFLLKSRLFHKKPFLFFTQLNSLSLWLFELIGINLKLFPWKKQSLWQMNYSVWRYFSF